MVDAAFNGLLVGSTGYVLSNVQLAEYPFLSTACVVGLCHGLFGLYGNIAEGTSNSKEAEEPSESIVSKLLSVTRSCVDIVIFPLINIELYMQSSQSSSLALGHGLFVIPLVFDLSYKVFGETGDCETTEALKELSTLGNIMSLLFLSLNESRLPVGLMAFAAFFAAYAPIISENMFSGSGPNVALLGFSTFFSLIPIALDERAYKLLPTVS